MAAAAVPAISMGAQYFMNRGQNKRTNTALDASTTGLQGSATDLSKFGDTLGGKAGGFLGDAQKSFGAANQSFGAANNYFSPVLNGGRAAIDQTLAPERAMITDTYRGADKALDGMRGGTRDLAKAELNRDRAGKLALLGPAARANAADATMKLGGMQSQNAATQAGTGGNLMGQAAGAKIGSSNAYGQLFSGANQQSYINQQNGKEGSHAIGNMIFDAVKSKKPKAGGGLATGPAPSMGAG